MQIDTRSLGDVLVVQAVGRLDSTTAAILDTALSGPPAKTAPRLVVDLEQVGYVSSAGLRVLLKAAKLARASGQKLALSGLAPAVRDVFDVSGFTKLFVIAPDPTAAAAALA